MRGLFTLDCCVQCAAVWGGGEESFLKKNKKILFFCVIFADLIRIVYVMKVCEAEIRHFILRISVRIKGSEQNVIYLCTDRQRIIKISANF